MARPECFVLGVANDRWPGAIRVAIKTSRRVCGVTQLLIYSLLAVPVIWVVMMMLGL